MADWGTKRGGRRPSGGGKRKGEKGRGQGLADKGQEGTGQGTKGELWGGQLPSWVRPLCRLTIMLMLVLISTLVVYHKANSRSVPTTHRLRAVGVLERGGEGRGPYSAVTVCPVTEMMRTSRGRGGRLLATHTAAF